MPSPRGICPPHGCLSAWLAQESCSVHPLLQAEPAGGQRREQGCPRLLSGSAQGVPVPAGRGKVWSRSMADRQESKRQGLGQLLGCFAVCPSASSFACCMFCMAWLSRGRMAQVERGAPEEPRDAPA